MRRAAIEPKAFRHVLGRYPTGVCEAGDHFIVFGEVQALGVGRDARPLLFFQGGYGRFTPLAGLANTGRP